MMELIELLMHRDNISRLAAENLVHECARELHELCGLEDNPSVLYEDACDIVMDYLGLEPDYLDLLISI